MPANEPPAGIGTATSVPLPVDERLVWVGYWHSSILPWFGPSLSATSRRAPIPASGALTFLCRSAFFGELEAHAGALEDHRLTAPSFPHRSDQHRCDTREGDCEKRADDCTQVSADDDGQQRGHRMQAHRSAGDARREHVVLDHLHHDEKDDHVDYEGERLREADHHSGHGGE